nr:unnamed protein product [Callosobruchus chinensis]
MGPHCSRRHPSVDFRSVVYSKSDIRFVTRSNSLRKHSISFSNTVASMLFLKGALTTDPLQPSQIHSRLSFSDRYFRQLLLIEAHEAWNLRSQRSHLIDLEFTI